MTLSSAADTGASLGPARAGGDATGRGGFRRRLLVSLLAAALLPLVVFGALALLQVDAAVATSLEGQVRTALTGANGLLERNRRDLVETTVSYATWPVVGAAVARDDLRAVQIDVVDFQIAVGDFDAVVVTSGRSVASGGEAAIVERLEEIGRRALSASPTEEDIGPGTVAGPDGVYLIAVVPVVVDSRTVGAVAIARRIDAPMVVEISRATGFQVAVVSAAGGSPVATDARLAERLAARPVPVGAEVTIGDGIAVGRAPITDAGGATVATLAIVNPVDLLDVVIANLVTLVSATLLLAAAGAALLAWALGHELRRQTDAVAGWLDALSAGGAPLRDAIGDADLRGVSRAVDDLAATLQARERRLRSTLDEIARLSPRLGVRAVMEAGTRAAGRVFGVDEVVLEVPSGTPVATAMGTPAALDRSAVTTDAGPPARVEAALEAVAPMASGPGASAGAEGERSGRLVARGAAVAAWEEPDRAIFDLYARMLGIAIRDADLVDRAGDRARELGRLADLQADFLRGVSHNLQQPLTTIRLVADDVADSDPARARDAAAHIRAESDRLSRVVGQLLTMSRLDAGTIRVDAEPLAPGPLVRHAWQSFRSSRRFSVDDRAPGVLAVADRACVEQILWILLDNAVRYAPRGPLVVRIEPRSAAALLGGPIVAVDDPRLAVSVAITVIDRGPGVAVEERDRIFQRFVRGSTSRGTDGTGLGLDVARGLARAMGGHLVYRETGAVGSAFELLLPAEPNLGPA